ncbi:MAG TPA: universal stress protein [Chloroflexota bacterium]|nr:universal stress protein [Chloroflexota bacterium]
MADNILVPLDGSELANEALPYAEAIAKTLGWGVVLLRVVSGDPVRHHRPGSAPIEAPLEDEMTPRPGYDVFEAEEAAASDALATHVARLRAAGVTADSEVGLGNAGDVIVERASEGDIVLIVMASHGRTGLARIFRGSVAAAVVDHSARPVLVVRPFRDDQARVDLEHAERVPAEHVDALRRCVDQLTTERG